MKNKLSALTSALALISSLPYEKDFMALIPPQYAPKVAFAAIVSTLILRFWPDSKEPGTPVK